MDLNVSISGRHWFGPIGMCSQDAKKTSKMITLNPWNTTMRIVDIEDAKADLPRLVAGAAAGAPFVIAVDGKPLVRVVAADAPTAGTKRRLGFMEGEASIPEDFDRIGTAETEAMFDRGE